MTNEEQTRVEETLGNSVICEGCGATLATYADACNVPLDVQCPGFLKIEAVLQGAAA